MSAGVRCASFMIPPNETLLLLKLQIRIATGFFEVLGQAPGEFNRHLLCFSGLSEEHESGEGFPMYVLRLKDGHHMPGKRLHLIRPLLARVESGQFEGGERYVVVHVPRGELAPHEGKLLDGSGGLALLSNDPGLYPPQPHAVKLAPDALGERLRFREELPRLRMPVEVREEPGEVMPVTEEEPRISVRGEIRSRTVKIVERLFPFPRLLKRL